jgi:hypothetical protein
MATGAEGLYEVVWPRSKKTSEIAPLAVRHDTLEGKKVAFLWDYLFRGDEIFPILESELKSRFPGMEFVGHEAFGSTHGDEEHEILENLPANISKLRIDAVVSGMGC